MPLEDGPIVAKRFQLTQFASWRSLTGGRLRPRTPLRMTVDLGQNVANPSSTPTPPTLWAILEYYQPNFSGAALQAHRILSRLAAQGYSVHVLTAADQAARHLAGQCRHVEGVRIHYLHVTGRRGWKSLQRLPPLGRWARTLNDVLRDASFHRRVRHTLSQHAHPGDILQWYIVGDFTWTVIRQAKQRGWHNVIQVSLLGSDDPSSFQASLLGISTALKRRCFFQADHVIGLSRALTDSCLRAGVAPERVLRIPNGVELDQFSLAGVNKMQRRTSLGLDPQRRYLVFVGSAIRRKGIDVVVPAYIEVARTVADVDLLVVGPCDFRDTTRHDVARQQLIHQLRAQLTAAGCAARVHWIGQVPNVADYLQAADLFFFPTRREGLPNAMSEAMACGLPVVAAWLNGITTDLVDDNVEGRLVAGHDPQDYARILIELCQDPEQLERMGKAARRRIEQECDLRQIVPQYAQLYEQLRQERLRR
jgi:glycosyltransferase involved in cell wall biosynthesis